MNEHGAFHLAFIGNTLHFKAIGAWNVETAIRWQHEVKTMVMAQRQMPWKCMIDLTEWELATPDVKFIIKPLNGWLESNKLQAIGIVCGLSIHQPLLEAFNATFSAVSIRYFQQKSTANKWLDTINI